MEFLQKLLDSSATPIFTAFLIGLLSAISPCPLAANITAIGYIGKNVGNRKRVFADGLFYSLGRVVAYTLLGTVLISVLRRGASIFSIQKAISMYGEMILGPALLLVGLFMLFGDKLHLKGFGYSGGRGANHRGGKGAFLMGMLFAMAFCPTSAVFYFGMLIPMSATASAGYFLPAVFAVATALPVIVVAWVLAFSVSGIGRLYNRMQTIQKWTNIIVATMFVVVGIYSIITVLL